MQKWIAALPLIFCVVSCNNQDHSSAIVESRMAGSKVLIVPVYDKAKPSLGWDVAKELTQSIHQNLAKNEKFLIADEEKSLAAKNALSSQKNPFGNEIAWMKEAFSGWDFVVFLELIEHKEVLNPHKGVSFHDATTHLQISLRVRSVDLRGQKPRIVLQEVVSKKNFLPIQFTKINFIQVPYGHRLYGISPLGMTHRDLAKQVTTHIDRYLSLAIESAHDRN